MRLVDMVCVSVAIGQLGCTGPAGASQMFLTRSVQRQRSLRVVPQSIASETPDRYDAGRQLQLDLLLPQRVEILVTAVP